MPSFLHAADLHLDSPLRGLESKPGAPVERIRGASRLAFERLVTAAIDRRVAFAVLVGDLYDTQPAFETYRFFHQQVQRLTGAGIPVAIVLGNHDHAGVSPRSGRLPDGVHVFASAQPESIELVPGVVVHAQSYSRRDVSVDLTPDYPRPEAGKLNIGLLHTALDGYSGEHARYAPSRRQALANHGYQYWALGHVHSHLDLVEANEVRIVYPGNLQGRHARETGPKGAVFVDYSGARIERITLEAFDDVRWHHVQIDAASLPEDGDPTREIEARVRRETAATRDLGRLAAVRISVFGEASRNLIDLGAAEVRDSLRAKLGDDVALFLEKINVDVRPIAVDRSEAERQLQDLTDSLARSQDHCTAIAGLAREVREMLRTADPTLAETSTYAGTWTDPVSEECARERMNWALGLVRDLLNASGGKR